MQTLPVCPPHRRQSPKCSLANGRPAGAMRLCPRPRTAESLAATFALTVRPDSSILPPLAYENHAIRSTSELDRQPLLWHRSDLSHCGLHALGPAVGFTPGWAAMDCPLPMWIDRVLLLGALPSQRLTRQMDRLRLDSIPCASLSARMASRASASPTRRGRVSPRLPAMRAKAFRGWPLCR